MNQNHMRVVWTVILLAVLVVLGVWLASGATPQGSSSGNSWENASPLPPPPLADENSYTLEAKLNEKASGPGIKITPIALVEDSRCPIDVVCIQAGTLRIKAKVESGLGASEMELGLGTAITTEAELVTLFEVVPSPKSQTTINTNDYIFKFRVTKRP